jgi:hypothetical protein
MDVVRRAIHDWDPYELLANGAPPDEFDREIASIVAQIPRISSGMDATLAVSRVFSSSFQADLFKPEHCVEVGKRLYEDLNARGLLNKV